MVFALPNASSTMLDREMACEIVSNPNMDSVRSWPTEEVPCSGVPDRQRR